MSQLDLNTFMIVIVVLAWRILAINTIALHHISKQLQTISKKMLKLEQTKANEI
ncbi:MAG: hypothetical protein ACXACY_30905 [Candidatus Hodarchaeales archaeon]|jgi:hypothetical protein